ncbi:hypothetical protein PHMEG_00041828 [Phytophthora megakarya]|uniref:DUSP domain-containing protein n=1 Tax=Phytophthora megakarya TaxID=4795 RepID=A0A225UB02_9STRA|nr:hypothetical protein PHMEG_00041828 [Phytophthora megakarya]
MTPSLQSPTPSDDSVDLECGLAPKPFTSRREMEREVVLAFDSRELRRHEAWFLVETVWLDAWMSYVLGDDDDANAPKRPGPLRNDTLFDREEYRIRANLQQTKDYRGVNPQVYALYAELYGTDDAKPIVRWTLDIYAMPVMIDDVREMTRVPNLKARSLITELNEELETKKKGLEGLRTREDKESWTYRRKKRSAKKSKKSKKKSKKRNEEEESSSDESSTSSDEETHGLLG